MAGWTVQLLQNGAVAMSTVTDASGQYVFAQVAVGSYTVCVASPVIYTLWAPSFGPSCAVGFGYPATVTPYDLNVIFVGLDFGYYRNALP